jgi:hypothetical protein
MVLVLENNTRLVALVNPSYAGLSAAFLVPPGSTASDRPAWP